MEQKETTLFEVGPQPPSSPEILPAVQPSAAPPTISPMQLAMERGIPPEQLLKYLEFQERWERARAEEAYASALTSFQRDCPPIYKRRTAKANVEKNFTGYKFISYDDVMEVAGPLLVKYGIVTGFDTSQTNAKVIDIAVEITVGTVTKSKKFHVPVPGDMRVNDTQRFGAAMSYAKKYALCAALNIRVADFKEDDGKSLDEYVSEAQAALLEKLIREKGADLRRFLAWASEDAGREVKSLRQVGSQQYAGAIELLRARRVTQPEKPMGELCE